LAHVDAQFSEDEIRAAVMEMYGEKDPGPDKFVGYFFKHCWAIIKEDMVSVMRQLHRLRGNKWHLLNIVHIVLLPKKDGASIANDYRPVILMHCVAKIS
jgi:hypothetical protein